MPNTLVPIYVLRSRCRSHHLDTMRSFTVLGNDSPDPMFEQLERQVVRDWRKQHRCQHHIRFDREMDKHYRYNTRTRESERV
jgi:hypothetical protein